MASSKNSARTPAPQNRSTAGSFLQFIAMSVVAGFVLAGLLIPPTTAVSLASTASLNWFKGLPDELSEGPLSQPSRILASDGTELATFYAENRKEVPLDKISQYMIDAQLAIEDKDFYEHGGIDGLGIIRAALNNIVNPTARQGASTITQQYVNNLLIDQAVQSGGNPADTMGANKDILDKIKEMKLAVSMEQNKTKDEILNGYLNIVNYGGTNYGVQAAAQYYWGVDAADLNAQQAATLAGMVQSPQYLDPTVNPEAAKERRNTVLYVMHEQGRITDAEYEQAVNSELNLDIHPVRSGCSAAHEAPYFCDYVRNVFLSSDEFGANPEERQALLSRGGLTIKTTLDIKAQRAAQASVEETQPIKNNPDNVSTAMISIAPGKGDILAMAQNSEYSAEEGPGNTVYNYTVNSALGGTGGFQPGSTFKPFSLAQWIRAGNGVNAVIDATDLKYPAGYLWHTKCRKDDTTANPGVPEGEPWTFHNAEQGWQRKLTVNEGIYNSVNSALYAMDSYLDLCGVGDIAADLGVKYQTADLEMKRIPTEESLASLIGAYPVTPMAMANAFAAFAAEGKYCEPKAISSVTSRKGKKMPIPETTCEQALDPNTARGVNFVLRNVLVRGSGYQRGIGLENRSAAKTGTTDNSTQTWMIGYTKGISTASWVGNVDQGSRSLNGLNIGGQRSDYVDGSSFAGRQWQRYMNQVKDNYDNGFFTNPSEQTLSSEIKSEKVKQ